MKQFLGACLFAFIPCWLSAQYEKILKDPDVIWAAEFECTYNLRPPADPDSFLQNEIVFWKNYDPKSVFPYRNGELLLTKMIEAAYSGAWPAWKPGDTVRQVSGERIWDDFSGLIVAFDVETGEESVKQVIGQPDPFAFTAVRAKQLLYFDRKKGEFELYTSAVAPVWSSAYVRNRNYKGEFNLTNPDVIIPFWLKMPPYSKKKLKKKPKLKKSSIMWAAQLKTMDNSPKIDSLHTLLKRTPQVMQVLLDRFHFDPHYGAVDALGDPIPFKSRHSMLVSSDSTFIIDPETDEEKIVVTDKSIAVQNILNLRLLEDWFWDERKQRLIIRLSGFAPVYSRVKPYVLPIPLFYRKKK